MSKRDFRLNARRAVRNEGPFLALRATFFSHSSSPTMPKGHHFQGKAPRPLGPVLRAKEKGLCSRPFGLYSLSLMVIHMVATRNSAQYHLTKQRAIKKSNISGT